MGASPKPRKSPGSPGTTSPHLIVPKFKPTGPPGGRIDVATTLQYAQALGFCPLAEFIKDLSINHLSGGRIPYANPEILLTCGNTDGFGKVMQMIPERGDSMLREEYTYPNAIQTAAPMVIGQNPTGTTLSLQRKREIYPLCEKYDVIIIEDDPYWYLQYPKSSHPMGAQTPPANSARKRYPFLEALTPSYLAIDASGRVSRLDTLSKTTGTQLPTKIDHSTTDFHRALGQNHEGLVFPSVQSVRLLPKTGRTAGLGLCPGRTPFL